MSDFVGIIPAAGKGRRIREYGLSRILPKPLFPVQEQCIIDSAVSLLERAGIDKIFVVVNHKADLIEEYLGDGREWGVDISYVEQPVLNGIAGAVAICEPYIRTKFVVALGDEITYLDNGCSVLPMMQMLEQLNTLAVEAVVVEHDKAIIKDTNELLMDSSGRIYNIVEKPQDPQTLMRGIGVYAFDHDVFDLISEMRPSELRGELEITNLMKDCSNYMQGAYGWRLPGVTININNITDLRMANRMMLGRNNA